jgi:hypothetical protein
VGSTTGGHGRHRPRPFGARLAAALAAAVWGAVGTGPTHAGAQPAVAAPASPLASATAVPVSVDADLVVLLGGAAVAAPLSFSRLERSPPAAHAVAGLVELTTAADAAAGLATVHAGVSSSNPSPPAGEPPLRLPALPGLELVADTPAPTVARGAAGVALSAAALRASVAGRTHTERNGQQVTASASCAIPSLELGDVGVRGLRSTVEVTARAGAPALVNYSLAIAEVRVGGRRVLGVDGGPVSVRVGPVAAADLAAQLRRQPGLSSVESPAGLTAALRLLEPRVDTSVPDAVSVTAPVVELTSTGVPGLAGPLSARLATATVSVATGGLADPGPEVGRQTPPGPSPVRRGPPLGSRPAAGPGPALAPGTSPEPAGDGPVAEERFALRRREPGPVVSRPSGLLLTVVVMGAAGLNALLVVGRAAYLMVKAGP